MGWGRTFLLGDIGNRLDIGDVERDVDSMRRTLRSQHNRDAQQDARIATLERQNEELSLYLASLVRVLVARNVLAREDVASFVRAIDGEESS